MNRSTGISHDISSKPHVMFMPPWPDLLELGSGISCTPYVMHIPPWLGPESLIC